MAKLFSAVLLIAALVAATAAALIFAAGDISMIECQDVECRVGCRTIGKIPEDTCHTPPFQHDKSMKAVCSQAPPTGLCYYMGIFKKNTTNGNNFCIDANAERLFYHQCNVCRPSFHREGTFEKTTCDSSNSMKLYLGCDKNCNNCNQTHSLTEKTCTTPADFPFAVEASAPAKCAQQIQYFHYNGTTCNGTAAVAETAYSGVCYGMGFGRSHLYQCA